MSATELMKELRAAGVVFTVPGTVVRHFSLATAAETLDCSPKYLREHLSEFPHAWRLSGGEIRIPKTDIEAWIAARRIFAEPK